MRLTTDVKQALENTAMLGRKLLFIHNILVGKGRGADLLKTSSKRRRTHEEIY